MSKLNAFFKNNRKKDDKIEYIVSEDFKEQDGTIRPFILRKLKGSEILKIQNAAAETDADGNQTTNAEIFTTSIIVACVEDPDLLNKDLQDSYEVTTPHKLIDEMLSGGEFLQLSKKCMEINGLTKTVKDLTKEAKN